MNATLMWVLLVVLLLLLAASSVRLDVWAAWLHERLDPLLHRLRH